MWEQLNTGSDRSVPSCSKNVFAPYSRLLIPSASVDFSSDNQIVVLVTIIMLFLNTVFKCNLKFETRLFSLQPNAHVSTFYTL